MTPFVDKKVDNPQHSEQKATVIVVLIISYSFYTFRQQSNLKPAIEPSVVPKISVGSTSDPTTLNS